MVFAIERQATHGSGPGESHEVAVNVPTSSVVNLNNWRADSGGKWVGQGLCIAKWRYVEVGTALADVELLIRTNAKQVVASESDPVPQRPADTQEGVR